MSTTKTNAKTNVTITTEKAKAVLTEYAQNKAERRAKHIADIMTIDSAKVLERYNAAKRLLKNLSAKQKVKPTKSNARRITDITEVMNAYADAITARGIITPDNVIDIGERIALKALSTAKSAGKGYTMDEYHEAIKAGKQNLNTSGNFDFINTLYQNLIADIHTRKAGGLAPFSDGYDVAQVAITSLCGFIGKSLTDGAENGETDKNGAGITVKTAVFRAVNRYIASERRREYKRAFVDITDGDGKAAYIEVPFEWDIDTAYDFTRVDDIISALNLTDKQAQILRYRMRGIAVDVDESKRRKGDATPAHDSIHTIARILGVSRQAVIKHLQAIQRKFDEWASKQPADVQNDIARAKKRAVK